VVVEADPKGVEYCWVDVKDEGKAAAEVRCGVACCGVVWHAVVWCGMLLWCPVVCCAVLCCPALLSDTVGSGYSVACDLDLNL